MSGRMVFLSNNPVFKHMVFPEWKTIFFSGSALSVLESARDKVHMGFSLTHHPLYGNFRPKHQPFRSILLQSPPVLASTARPEVDVMSLHLIEEALAVYAADKGILPEDACPALARDCSRIDFELMQTPLRQAGWHGAEWPEA